VDGGRVRFGKRREWLEPDAPFFGWQLVATELATRVTAIADALGAAQVIAYGELFGGGYPHPDVPEAPGLSPVQTGIWYHPGLQWALLDLFVASDDADVGSWVAWREVSALAEAHGVYTPPVRGRGRRTDLEMLPVEFTSAVATSYGLPPIADNLAEGLVIKPERGGAARPILKKKIAAFSEARFGEAEAWDPRAVGRTELMYWAERLVNPARIASARSKLGADPASIVDEVVLDVGIDLETTFPQGWTALGGEQDEVLALVRARAEELVRGPLLSALPPPG
jgi:hypothetical protein